MEASFALLGIQDESQGSAKLFLQILSSRVVMEDVIRRHDLVKWFKLDKQPEAEAMEQSVLLLKKTSDFILTEAGMTEISVRLETPWFAGSSTEDRTRRLAADVANTFVEVLDEVNREKSLSRAKQTRLYLERQLAENEEVMRRLGQTLAVFQREHGAVALDAQTKALIENAAKLKAQLLTKEVELGVARNSMTAENPAITALENEVGQLRAGLQALVGDQTASYPAVDLSAGMIPDLAVQLATYQRELQAQLLLQSYLQQQFYQAKIQEARDSPTVQVLDPAIPPVERFAPKRKLMVIGAFVSGLIIGVIAVGVLELSGGLRRPSLAENR
jgi:uncharacterized protein involved in exopolysaccharide biosynthesis